MEEIGEESGDSIQKDVVATSIITTILTMIFFDLLFPVDFIKAAYGLEGGFRYAEAANSISY